MTPEIAQSRPQEQFLEEAKIAMGNLRNALLEMAAGTGADLGQPQDLSRRYNLDKTLTWKISRIVRDQEIATSVSHVPGRRRMTTLLAAMRDGGASEKSVDGVWRAFDDFEKLVQVHSGDRGTLDVMVAGAGSKNGDRRMENLRKSGFQCNSAVWGVRARMHFGINAIAPSDRGNGLLEAFTVCGFLGLERLRLGLPWAVADAITWDYVGTPDDATTPLHPGGVNGVPLLPEFCSRPVPQLRTVEVDKRNRRYELPEGAIGLGNAVDLTLGWSWPPVMSMHAQVTDEIGEHGVNVSTPTELVVNDLWIHRSLLFAMNPKGRMYSRLPNGPRYPNEGRDVGVLPIPDTVVDLGFGAASASTAEFPRCGELLQHAMERREWNSNEFRGFRFRVKYPPIPSLMVLQHPLLPPQ